jgi:predicted AlkP superfamily phosphohydrolase/phosphomutase
MVSTPRVVPRSLESAIDRIQGIPSYRDYFNSPNMDTVDLDTFIEIQELGFDWITSAVKVCRREHPCEITSVYTVSIDTVNHLYRNILEKEQTVARNAYLQARNIERRTYEAIDHFIGRLLQIRQRNRLVVLVSDHSAVTYRNNFRVDDALKQADLLVTRKTREGEEAVLEKSQAICQRQMHVYVNLKGRNPGGIVDRKNHEDVVNKIIAALYDYTDPATRCKPVALALRREDAGVVGLRGEGIGDVVVAVRGGFGQVPGDDVHGHRLPGGEHNGKSMKCLLLFSGAGIRKKARIKRTVSLKDIAPTIAHLMNFPAPRDTEGGIIYQMLDE